MSDFPVVRAAVVQAAPVLFERDATIDKLADLVADAASQGARLVLLPEAFIPAYPRGLSFGAVVGSRSEEGRDLWARYWANSVDLGDPVAQRIGDIAARHNVYLAIGLIEKDAAFGAGTLYCTLAYFGPDGKLLAKHRKLKPTGSERLIWGEGDGSTLSTVETEWATLGGLICWENYMPLARATMYAKGVEIYVAPTADCRDAWQATMRHIAVEGRCFVLGCNQFVTRDMYPSDLAGPEIDALPEQVCRGGSVVYSPLGERLAGPLYGAEETLVVDLDMREIARAKYDFDAVGHYGRGDVFRLSVDERPQLPLHVAEPFDGSQDDS